MYTHTHTHTHTSVTSQIKLSFNASRLPGEFPTSRSRFSFAGIKLVCLHKVAAPKAPVTNWQPLLPEFVPSVQTLMADNSHRGKHVMKQGDETREGALVVFLHLQENGVFSADSSFLQHTSSSATLPASPSSPVAPWDSLWEGREPAKLTFRLSDRLWYWMLTCLRPPSSFSLFPLIPPSPPPSPSRNSLARLHSLLAPPYSQKPRASSSNDTELQLNQERRANRWQGEKQLKGCGRRGGERKWTGGVKEVRTAGWAFKRKAVEEENRRGEDEKSDAQESFFKSPKSHFLNWIA